MITHDLKTKENIILQTNIDYNMYRSHLDAYLIGKFLALYPTGNTNAGSPSKFPKNICRICIKMRILRVYKRGELRLIWQIVDLFLTMAVVVCKFDSPYLKSSSSFGAVIGIEGDTITS